MRQLRTLIKQEKRRKKIIKTIGKYKKLKFHDRTLIVRLLMNCDEFSMTSRERELLSRWVINVPIEEDKIS